MGDKKIVMLKSTIFHDIRRVYLNSCRFFRHQIKGKFKDWENRLMVILA